MFEAEGVVRGDTRFKCAPPLRGSRNRDMLWRALADGTVDFLASDHTPTTLEMRAGSLPCRKASPARPGCQHECGPRGGLAEAGRT